MQTADMLEGIGGLIAQLKSYATKLPPIVHLSSVPTGVKPKPEAIAIYEEIVTRVRTRSAGTGYRTLSDSFVDSLEAFEGGNLLGATQPLLAILDHLERMRHDKEIEARQIDEKRIAEYRAILRQILPGNTPELKESGGGG